MGKQPKKKKIDHKIEEKMSHGNRNGTFKAPLTLKKIRYVYVRQRARFNPQCMVIPRVLLVTI